MTTKQDYETPREFTRAIELYFGVTFDIDLAASTENRMCERFIDAETNSLSQAWHGYISGVPWRAGWLNPPFRNVAPWMKKCAEAKANGRRVFALVLASVGSGWYAEHVAPHAQVYALSPRITFVGEAQPFNKDLILCDFRPGFGPSFTTWRWK